MLLRLKAATESRYDRVLFCHGPDSQGPVDMIDRVLAVCGDILGGRDDSVPFRGRSGEPARIAKAMDFRTFTRADGGVGNLVYDPAKIR